MIALPSISAGNTDSYNRKFVRYQSYTSSFYGWKLNPNLGYGESDPAFAYLYCDMYINYLKIDGKILINSLTYIGGADDTLDNINYRDDGYGLGATFAVDGFNNLPYFSQRGIVWYTANRDNAGAGWALKIREQTKMVLVVSDYWGHTDTSLTWSFAAGYKYNPDPLIGSYTFKESVGEDISTYTDQDIENWGSVVLLPI